MALQEEREIEVKSPLGKDVLLLQNMSATEKLGGLFEYELALLSDDDNIDFEDLLGKSMVISLELPGDGERKRYFNGIVTSFTQTGRVDRYAEYQATLRPWLWLLSKTADCRIFQKKSVPDIIKEIFKENDFSDFDDLLSHSYEPWEYCVQYRETDFNFISRLMEQEGIYYYFTHEEEKHTLVLADSYSSHDVFGGYEKIGYFPPGHTAVREKDHIYDLSVSCQVESGEYVLDDFNFERPKSRLAAKSAVPRNHQFAEYEVYDYPGEYTDSARGERYARARIEELQADFEHVFGSGNARGIAAGFLFELEKHPRLDQNREYLVESTQHYLESNEYASSQGAAGGAEYSCSFVAIDGQQQYRSRRMTPKPVVQGPQTAMVVGKAGEEIWTDKYGRIKVQFHWDRYGKSDENSSCWVRVAQIWGGQKWGGMFIPRIGQEVIVEFMEGDPDRPIVTGRVYNADAMPPYDLPDEATKSTIKSESSKGGGGCNELRFEDKKGEEQVFIHAEKDMDRRVKNDLREYVANEQHLIVEGAQKSAVNADKHEAVKGNHVEKTEGDYSLDVLGKRDDKVGMLYAIESGMEVQVKAGMRIVLEAASQISIVTPGGMVDIGPAGVTISGAMVSIVQGGSGASGMAQGANPSSPDTPDEADDY